MDGGDSPIRRIILVGACYVDTVLGVNKYPAEDHKMRALTVERRRGGNCANTLEVLQQLPQLRGPVELVLLSVLPARTSTGTRFVKASFDVGASSSSSGNNNNSSSNTASGAGGAATARHKVNMTRCFYRDEYTEPASSYIIRSYGTGSRTIVNYNELPEMTFAEFKAALLGLTREGAGDAVGERTWFHFEGREVETTRACMQWVRRTWRGARVSVEVEKPNRAGLGMLAALADVVFYSRNWAESSGYEGAAAVLASQAALLPSAGLLCCTWGELGAAAVVPATGFLHHERARTVHDGKVVDTIGAGDTFIAAMLHAIISHDHSDGDTVRFVKDALLYANRLAGRKVAQEGFAGLSTGFY